MPGLARKIVVFAAVDGLVLQPVAQRNQRTPPSLSITYASHSFNLASSTVRRNPSSASFEAHGIIGLLSVASNAYLISISHRKQVAQIKGSPIYVVTGVSLIPLSSQKEAERAIQQAKRSLQEDAGEQDSDVPDSDCSEDEGQDTQATLSEDDHLDSPIDAKSLHLSETGTSIIRDVMYGRFAERWFSRKGWGTERRRTQGMSTKKPRAANSDATLAGSPKMADQVSSPQFANPIELSKALMQQAPARKPSALSAADNVTNTLLPKLLQTTRMVLASRSFFFSYDYDITRRMGYDGLKSRDIPLHRTVDPLFFWNHHLAAPFIDGSHHHFVLPLMQGFVGQRAFTVNRMSEDPAKVISGAQENVEGMLETQEKSTEPSGFLVTLISRRSVLRPGLRYLRRGVDQDGNAANSVETEQLLSRVSWSDLEKVYSFTQIRGSIPLFFSQSPYALKPPPIMQHSFDTNHAAFQRHFANLVKRYGRMQVSLLVDRKGGEATIGEQYEEHTKQLNSEGGIRGTQIGFEWFDFHAVCRSMKFEKVSLLVDALQPSLDKSGSTVGIGGKLLKKQIGVVRTNCMDCLDRTNVAQSACASRILEKQLADEGIEINLEKDPTTQWFNTLWADNGDAISKQYSSTAALKGDYTRTRKRNYRGAINDLGLTLTRYYTNLVSDFFSQAAIDYLLGNVTSSVFEDFEADMMSADPAISMHKVRSIAIETSSKIVVLDQREDVIGGWAMLSPQVPNTVRTFPFEEIVLLLTDAALYAVHFDWNTEKVSSFERVDLRSVTGLVRGTYITSTFVPSQMDEQRNVGLVIKYKPGQGEIQRRNTRSLSSEIGEPDGAENEKTPAGPSSMPAIALESALSRLSGRGGGTETKYLAFKTLTARSSIVNMDCQESSMVSEKELVQSISDEIQRAALAGKVGGQADEHLFVEDTAIISLEEAKKSNGYLEQWSHSLKKFVWA